MLRIRFYLAYFFSLPLFYDKGFFYSCFEITKYFKNVYIDVYIYDGIFESTFQNYIFEHFKDVSDLSTDPETRLH